MVSVRVVVRVRVTVRVNTTKTPTLNHNPPNCIVEKSGAEFSVGDL